MRMIKCPCCGEKDVPEDLFKNKNSITMPIQIELLREPSDGLSNWLIHIYGRFFCLMEAPLPLKRADSPIIVRTWVEITRKVSASLLDLAENEHIAGSGVLAADIPGFLGTLGSKVKFLKMGTNLATISQCDDNRLDIPANLNHEEMLALYRSTWGNSGELINPDQDHRKELLENYSRIFDSRFLEKDIIQYTFLAGMEPLQIAIAPPRDTGDPVYIATLGNSEIELANMPRFEFIGSFKNPSDEFISSFGDLGAISRHQHHPNSSFLGAVIRENEFLPGTKMSGWIIGPSSILDEQDQFIELEASQSQVLLLQAYPLYEEEMIAMQTLGPKQIIDLLAEIDMSDLERDLIV